MKGVSAVIAVILILMIVVAMAALAYTWFTSMATDLMEGAGENIEHSTDQMSKSFSIISASCTPLQFTIMNTGTANLTTANVQAFVDGTVRTITVSGGVASIASGQSATFTGPACTDGQTLRVVIESGAGLSKTLE
ncbi:MAG: hypothetical protein JW700_01990 [Candidatus Aenigmarchaeota archaeon]|nr:hypothetical protein [Candidatus Aenigmarchaeota archaeon]